MMDYYEREEIKGIAWGLLRGEQSSLDEKACAIFMIIDAHYWRAREQLDDMPASFRRRVHGKRYTKGYELDIDVYTRNWLAANKNIPGCQDAVEHFMKSTGYAPEASKFLPDGATSYKEPK